MRVPPKVMARVSVISRLGSFVFHIVLVIAHFAPILLGFDALFHQVDSHDLLL
jgi:hypothetical protein